MANRECVITENNITLVAFTNLIDEIESPSSNWSDFNRLYKDYLLLKKMNLIDSGIVSFNCVIEPNPENYPNY